MAPLMPAPQLIRFAIFFEKFNGAGIADSSKLIKD